MINPPKIILIESHPPGAIFQPLTPSTPGWLFDFTPRREARSKRATERATERAVGATLGPGNFRESRCDAAAHGSTVRIQAVQQARTWPTYSLCV